VLVRADEIAHLRCVVVHLHAELSENASFESMKEWRKITIERDGRGRFVARREARDQPGTEHTFHFELRFDQTERPPVLASLDVVRTALPVKGSSHR
jgi:hypothetical protein